MFHYLFTNDLRISKLDTALKEAGHCFHTNTVPSPQENKSANNNMNTLGAYFTLFEGSNCARLASEGKIRPVILNTIKKFQYPNTRTKQSFNDTIDDGISFAPLRTVVKILYLMNTVYGFAYLHSSEILDFLFYNSAVAKTKAPDLLGVLQSIIDYRKTGVLPSSVSQASAERNWLHQDRQIKEMLSLLEWAGCAVIEGDKVTLDNSTLTKDDKAALYDIIHYNDFWNPIKAEKFSDIHNDYRHYMDIKEAETEIDTIAGGVVDEYLSPEWFHEKGQQYIEEYNKDVLPRYEQFRNTFSIEFLSSLDDTNILESLFLNKENHTNLCYCLEFDKNFVDFGGIRGGNSSKYGLYYNNQMDCWTTGRGPNASRLTDQEAIRIGTEIKEKIVSILTLVEDSTLNTIDDYKKVYKSLKKSTGNTIDKMFILKYLHIMFPDRFPNYFSPDWHKTILNLLSIPIEDTSAFVRMGRISLFIEKCDIPSYVFSKVIEDYLYLTDTDEGVAEAEDKTYDLVYKTEILPDETRNRIFFGAPGTGKSFNLEKDKDKLLKQGGSFERVTFHPDYTYANFVGSYKPVPDGTNITYKFVPGPFMRVYVDAIMDACDNKSNAKPHVLIVEEINRANVAAVFGDVFQLLDRTDNISEYPITPSEDVKAYLAATLGGDISNYNEIKIPDNMFIWATMNSADQGVFPMDTAFKRRWDFLYIGIDEKEEKVENCNVEIAGQNINWNQLRKAINNHLTSLKINEDKLLGPFFINKAILKNKATFIDAFKNKVIMYLFEDAAKQKRNKLFAANTDNIRYSQICEDFDTKGVKIFVPDIYRDLIEEDDTE